MTRLVPVSNLSFDDLEALMETHGGAIVRNVETEMGYLFDARVNGRRVPPIGPVPIPPPVRQVAS